MWKFFKGFLSKSSRPIEHPWKLNDVMKRESREAKYMLLCKSVSGHSKISVSKIDVRSNKNSNPVQSSWKWINNESRDFLYQIIRTSRMQDSGELPHFWTRQVFYPLVPVVHYPALPFAVRGISCCESNMEYRAPWVPNNGILPFQTIHHNGASVVNHHAEEIICGKKKQNAKNQKQRGGPPHILSQSWESLIWPKMLRRNFQNVRSS